MRVIIIILNIYIDYIFNFNIIYNLTNIFFTKKNLKKFCLEYFLFGINFAFEYTERNRGMDLFKTAYFVELTDFAVILILPQSSVLCYGARSRIS